MKMIISFYHTNFEENKLCIFFSKLKIINKIEILGYEVLLNEKKKKKTSVNLVNYALRIRGNWEFTKMDEIFIFTFYKSAMS